MRYAIYWCPGAGDTLLHAGEHWLGRSVVDASILPRPIVAEIADARLAALTNSASRYGFHATIKAPLYLKAGIGEEQFLHAIAELAGMLAPFAMPVLAVRRLGRFLALRPAEDETALNALARRVVIALDGYRRPLSVAELARRSTAALTAHEQRLLQRWDYPYVLDAYRFHLTLTDPLDDADASLLAAVAQRHFASALALPRLLDALAVFVEPAPDAPFTLLARMPLGRR